MKLRNIFMSAMAAGPILLAAQWQVVHNFHFHIQPGTLAATGGDTVIVAADNGNMHFSADGGQTFVKDSLPFPYSWFHDIHFPTNSTGYVCGGTAFGSVKSPIAKTIDGGQSWDSLSGNQFGYELQSVFFTDEDTGYFGGQNIIIKTTDGGQTFTVDSLPHFSRVADMYFIDAATGFYLAGGDIYKTTDGAQNWNVVHTDTVPSFLPGFTKLDFVNSQVGFTLTRFGGKLLKTTDGGNTWDYVATAVDTLTFTDFDFVDGNTGYAISTRYIPALSTSEGRIFKTTDSGHSWTVQYRDTSQHFVKVSMQDKNIGYVLGDASILATTNGGVGLNEVQLPDFEVYPNPAAEKFHLITPEGLKPTAISLSDISGREVRNWQVKPGMEDYSLFQMKPGIYVLHIKYEGGTVQKKLVVD